MKRTLISPLEASTAAAANNTSKMSFLIVSLLALLVSISAFGARSSDAKPLNQNQVKFRRLPPREFSALIGSGITIECEAGSSPPPTIHWLKNGKRIQQARASQLDENLLDDGQQPLIGQPPVDDINRIALSSTRSRLFIDCAHTDDEATYTCVAENAFSRIASSTKLNLIRPVMVVAAEAEAAAAAAAAQPTDNSLSATGSGESATELQQQQQEANDLSAMPQCLSQRNSRSSEPARIHMWTHNIVEIMKNDVVLYCRSNIKRQQIARGQQPDLAPDQTLSAAAATVEQQQQPLKLTTQPQQSEPNSKASVSWTLPDDKIVSQHHSSKEHRDNTNKFEILETGDLLIRDLRWEDMGSYVCTVSNELGSDSVSTFVYPASVKSVKSKRAALNQALKID